MARLHRPVYLIVLQLERAMENNTEKKAYSRPSIEDFGKVADLTATGLPNPGADAKSGSVASMGV
jgi:hypothetical protein